MATYIPGVGSYLPDFKPFTPDYKFLSNVLETKTLKYETNYKALNDLYSKVVYGDLSRADTQEMRDQYAENLGPKLQQISGMDLSMSQNVEAAKALFKPFFEEDLIVKDLVTTKKYKNEMQYVDMLKNSPVKEQRDLYWQTGVQKMQYEMEDFVSATEDEALKMSLPQYVPDADLYEMAMGYLNESELGTDIVTTISENGEWLVHRKNGDLITNEALTMVQKAMKDDPRVVNAYHADAFVKSRQYADKGIEEGRFATVNEGQAAWASEQINTIEAEIAERNAEIEKRKKEKEKQNQAWKKVQQQTGVVKGSEEEKVMNENASTLEALKQRLQEMNLLLDDKPEAEVNMQTTGEYKPEDTKSLLYRAYSLLMNYNMESDLQAAALTYSNKGKMVQLEANPYMKMKKQHQYDLSKLSVQHQYKLEEMQKKLEYDKELAEYEAELESALIGANFADIFSNVSTSDPGTITGMREDEDGNIVVEADYDYVESSEAHLAEWNNKNENDKVDWALQMLQKTTDNEGSGVYSIDGIGEGSLIDLKSKILDPSGGVKAEYKEAFTNHFDKMGDLIENVDPNVASFANGEGPLLLSSASGREEFNSLQNTYVGLITQEEALQDVAGKFYKTAKSNLDKAIQTSLSVDDDNEYQDLMQKATENGMPQMFYEDANGVTRKYSLDEYKDVFAQWAAENGNKVSIKDTPYDDTSFWTGRGSERSAVGDTWAGLGHGKDEIITIEKRREPGGAAVYVDTPVKRLGSTLKFQRDISDQQAEDFYNTMSDMMNLGIRGKLETIVDPEAHTGDKAEYVKMFDVYDVKQAMRGVDESAMNAGDIMNNPTYEYVVDPLQLTPDGVEQLKNINFHISQDPKMHDGRVFLAPYGFNELTKMGYGNEGDEEYLGQDGSELDDNRLTAGRRLWEQYTQDLVRMQAKGATKSDYPGVTIKYFPTWTSDPNNLDSKYAGYTITFDEDYIAQYQKDGGFLKGVTGNVVSVVVDKESDINSKKYGEFTFSHVATQISTNEKKNYAKQVPYGGSFNVTQNANGAYDINYQIMQFDNESGQFKTAMFSEHMMDNNGNLITQQNRQYLDFYTNQYLLQLQQVGNLNQRTIDAWKKAHPDLVLNDPDYRFSN